MTLEYRTSFPASSAQRRLWALQNRYPDSRAYTVTQAVHLRGPVDPRRMAQALALLVERHDQLRTVFELDAGGLTQHVLAPDAVPFRLAEAQVDPDAVAAWMADEVARPFDLAQGPLYRASLLALGPERWLLVLSIHHIVTDGWSMALLFEELGDAYRALSGGARPTWAAAPGAYADAVAREAAHLGGADFAADLAQAVEALAGASPVLDLPVAGTRRDEAPPSVTLRAPLPADLAARLEQRAKALGATPFMLHAAVYAVLLAWYTNQDEVMFGVPVAGRGHEADARTVGMFVNTVPVRVAVGPDDTWDVLVDRVRDTVLDACAREVPLDALAERLGGFPLQAMLAAQPGALPLPRFDGIDAAWWFVDLCHAKFDLTLAIDTALAVAADGSTRYGTYAALEYRADILPAALAARMLEHWQRLTAALLERPDGAWSAALPRTADEDALLAGLLLARQDVEPIDPVAAFAAQAWARPDAPAVYAGTRTLSYRALDERVAALQAALQQAGVVPGDFVGVCLTRQPDLVASLLAVLRCGAAYVPFDPSYPPGRLGFIAQDARCALILVEPATRDALPPEAGRTLDISAVAAAAGAAALPAAPAAPESTAYLIYTSGSTGRPKGVAIPHRALRAFLGWATDAFDARQLALVLASTSVCFDLSVFEIFLPLARGGALRLVNTALDLAEQAEPVPTLINTVPSAMTELLRAGALDARVQVVNLAGEALTRSLVDAIHAASSTVRVFNLYGPSEDTTYSTWCEVARGSAEEPTIGVPIAGTNAYVLDHRLLPVPVGVDGELFLGGAGVTLGYLGRPGLSAERYLPDPALPGARMYRTGDRVRITETGALRYLGRFDHQVKLRGFRIEIMEIESRMRAVPGVETAIVAVRPVAGADQLVGYWSGTAAADAIGAALAADLPAYMVPRHLVRLEQFPLNANGKIDRAALPAPAQAGAGSDADAPMSDTEREVAALMAQVVKAERLGADADFVELGGHSLLAMRLMVGVRERFGVRLRLSDIFKYRTVRALSARLDALRTQEIDLPPLTRSAGTEPAPLSFAQERMWLVERLRPGSTMLNIGAAMRLAGAPDAGDLRQALQLLTDRHEALRLRIESGADGVPRQRALPEQTVRLQECAVGSVQERDAVLRTLLATPFDLATEPPARWMLLHGPDETVLGLVIHHAVADAWSLDILFDELDATYEAVRTGTTAPQPPALSPRDHALWQRTHLDRPAVLQPDLTYWRQRLANLPGRLQLAWDHAPAQAHSYQGARLRRPLDGAAVGALLALARPTGATPFVALLTVYQALLGRLARQDDVAVGTPIANRDLAGTERLVGCLLNTLVLRADLSDDPSFERLLARTKQDSLAAFDHQRAPFELVVAALGVERSLAHTPVIQTMFVLHEAHRTAHEAVSGGLRAASVDVPPVATQYDVTLMIARDDEGWHATWDYRSDLFEPETVAGFAACYEALLAQAARQPGLPLSRLALGAPPPPPLAADAPLAATLPALFAAQAAAWPDAPAVRDAEGVLTYRELDQASTRMAHRLAAAGVQLEDRVAVLLPKSRAAVVAMLATVKAGAAFLCLDPGLPDDRLRWIAADAAVSLYVTNTALAARLGLASEQVLPADAQPAAVPDGAADGTTTPLPGAAPTPEHLAYVIYTSGSTGTPKGVLLTHRGFAQLQALHRDRLRAGPGAHVLQYAPVTFDASVWDLAMALLTGACLHLAEPEDLLPGAALGATLAARGITHLTLPPSNLALLPAEAGTLRTVVVAGEPLPAELAQRWAGKVQLWNGYGPTEATVCATIQDCADTLPGRAPDIGRALSGTRAYVLDAGLNPLPPGVPGELYLAGQGIARGYLNRPQGSAAAFLPNPFADVPGARMYRTGDLARATRDGRLEFLGRADDQLKLRGIRIEPGEIEHVLAGLDARIEDAAVALAEGGGGQYLIGFVTGTERFDPEPLRAALAARLPGYMVPAWLQFVERFPFTQNGKLDRKALARQGAAPHADGGGAPPRGALEQEIAAIWREVLGVDVGRAVSFFSAGGTSLAMTRLYDRLDARYRNVLKLVDLFQLNTVAAIAQALEQRGAVQPAAADFDFRL